MGNREQNPATILHVVDTLTIRFPKGNSILGMFSQITSANAKDTNELVEFPVNWAHVLNGVLQRMIKRTRQRASSAFVVGFENRLSIYGGISPNEAISKRDFTNDLPFSSLLTPIYEIAVLWSQRPIMHRLFGQRIPNDL